MAGSGPSRGQFERLLAQDADELAALLAQSDPDAEETLYSFEDARRVGESIVDRLSGRLRTRVCDEWQYCKRREENAFDDDVTLAVAVADVILSVVGAYPVAIIAALLVKKGLGRFCGC